MLTVAPFLKRPEGGAHRCYGVRRNVASGAGCRFSGLVPGLRAGTGTWTWTRNRTVATISSPDLVCSTIKPDGSGDVPLGEMRHVCFQMTDGSSGALDFAAGQVLAKQQLPAIFALRVRLLRVRFQPSLRINFLKLLSVNVRVHQSPPPGCFADLLKLRSR